MAVKSFGQVTRDIKNSLRKTLLVIRQTRCIIASEEIIDEGSVTLPKADGQKIVPDLFLSHDFDQIISFFEQKFPNIYKKRYSMEI